VRALLVAWPIAALSVTLFFLRFMLTGAAPAVTTGPWIDAAWRMAMAVLMAAASTLQALIFAFGIWPKEEKEG
jgi:hypothetical protein